MPRHHVGTHEEWQRARDELLAQEKELTRRNDELARLRRELPWVRVDKGYTFDTEDGPKTLPELFDGRSQLLVYHFMFGPAYSAGCPVCSSGADTFDGAVAHMNARDITFTCVSRAPLDKLLAYRERMGWTFPWASAAETDFSFDFGAAHTVEELAPFLQSGELGPVPAMAAECGTDPAGYMTEMPFLNAFALDDGVVYHTYATTGRGLEVILGYYPFIDRTPFGRNEGVPAEVWMRRHDEYPAGIARGR